MASKYCLILFGGLFVSSIFIGLGVFLVYSATLVQDTFPCVYLETIDSMCYEHIRDHSHYWISFASSNVSINNKTQTATFNLECGRNCKTCECNFIKGNIYTCWYDVTTININCHPKPQHAIRMLIGAGLLIAICIAWILGIIYMYKHYKEEEYIAL